MLANNPYRNKEENSTDSEPAEPAEPVAAVTVESANEDTTALEVQPEEPEPVVQEVDEPIPVPEEEVTVVPDVVPGSVADEPDFIDE